MRWRPTARPSRRLIARRGQRALVALHLIDALQNARGILVVLVARIVPFELETFFDDVLKLAVRLGGARAANRRSRSLELELLAALQLVSDARFAVDELADERRVLLQRCGAGQLRQPFAQRFLVARQQHLSVT